MKFWLFTLIFLKKMDSVFLAVPAHFLRPHRNLGLADMSFAQEEHAQAALPDSAAHSVCKLSSKKTLVEFKLCALRAAALLKLSLQAFWRHPDSH